MPSLLSKSGIFSKIPAVSKPKYEACENSDTESNRMSDETLLWNPEQFKSKGISFATKIAITANVLLFVFSGTTLLHAYQRDEKAHMNADLRKISAYCKHHVSSLLSTADRHQSSSSRRHGVSNDPQNELRSIRRRRTNHLARATKPRGRRSLGPNGHRRPLASFSVRNQEDVERPHRHRQAASRVWGRCVCRQSRRIP